MTRLRKFSCFAGAFASAVATPVSHALAEVCDKVRPDWTVGEPVSQLDEVIYLINHPPGLVVLAVLAAVLLLRSHWIAVPGAVLSVLLAGALLRDYLLPGEVAQAAVEEGCVGPPYLAVALLIAIAVLMLANVKQRQNGSAG